MKLFTRIACILSLVLFPGASAWSAGDVEAPKPKGLSAGIAELAAMPIQSGGRIKPLEAYARETVLFVTGRQRYGRWSPVELLLSWTVEPRLWADVPVININSAETRRQLLLEGGRKFYSFNELANHPTVQQYSNFADEGFENGARLSGAPNRRDRSEELRALFHRMMTPHLLATGQGWPLIPREDKWEMMSAVASTSHGGAPSSSHDAASDDAAPVADAFKTLLTAYKAGEAAAFAQAAHVLRAEVEKRLTSEARAEAARIPAEVLYLKLSPYFWAWILYLVGATLWAFGAQERWGWRARRGITAAAGVATFAGFALVTFGMGLRVYVAGRPPVTNMYESIVWVSFGVMIFTAVLYFIQKQKYPILMAVGSLLACVTLVAADAAPTMMDPGIHPLVPVLRDNFWLTIHVLTITLGYAAFALSMGLGDVALFQYAVGTATPKKTDLLNQLNYRAMQFGVVLLAGGTILGGVWADYSWGRFWGWDPKETWAFIALLCYVAILHARYTGKLSAFGFAAWTVVAFLSVLMAWYGVNFILGVGLHSYGFSSGGFSGVAAFVAAQLGFVAFAAWRAQGGGARGAA